MNKIMQVTHLDTARTNNLTIMLDAADALASFCDDDEPNDANDPTPPRPRPTHHGQTAKKRRATPSPAPLTTRQRQPRAPTVPPHQLAHTTTGVGAVSHKFSPSLDGYTTYNARPSKRPPPTERVKT